MPRDHPVPTDADESHGWLCRWARSTPRGLLKAIIVVPWFRPPSCSSRAMAKHRFAMIPGLGIPFVALLIPFCFLPSVMSQPATVPFKDCFSGNRTEKLNISTVYAQFLDAGNPHSRLNFTILGVSGQGIIGASNDSSDLGAQSPILVCTS